MSGERGVPGAGLPIVDLSDAGAGAAIDQACVEWGFFYLVGHGVDAALQARLEEEARRFFALPDGVKAAIAMEHGGPAWRGWFGVGDELTSGTPDLKEGLYFGAELGPSDPRVAAGVPLHGANLFPPGDLRDLVLDWIDAMTGVGHGLIAALGDERLRVVTADPLVLFRIFHYPPAPPSAGGAWGVGEHTDYGLLTILGQDGAGGLQVRTPSGWVDAPPIEGAFVCNLGDMLERLSGGRYRSTAHRVRNSSGVGRLSYPFFFDPAWDADVGSGTYGDYILGKVRRVFPALGHHLT